MRHRAVFDSLESRRLLTFAHLDPTYANGGPASAGYASSSGDGAVYAMPDQGSILSSARRDFRRIDSEGRVRSDYGNGGALTVAASTDVIATAVDGTTGRLAMITVAKGDVRTLDFYSSRGRLERSIPQAALGDVDLRYGVKSMAFDRSGRLVMAGETQVARVLPRTGALDASFAGDGTFELPAVDVNDGSLGGLVSRVSFAALSVASDGSITVVRSNFRETDYEGESTTYRMTHRLRADGTVATEFGTDGVLTETAGSYRIESVAYYSKHESYLTGLVTAKDGSLLRLIVGTSESDYGNGTYGSSGIVLVRLDAKGVRTGSIDLTDTFRGQNGSSPRLLIDSMDRAYVVTEDRMIRVDGQTLALDAAFNGEAGTLKIARQMAEPRFAVDARDRLLMIGQPLQADGVKRSLAVLAIKGSTAGFNAPAGKATLLPGGLLDVAGTSRNDEVRLRRVAGKLEVIINGQSRRFSFANVTGIVIHTGSGNDSIRADVSGMLLGAIIQGGAGKDRISGTNAGDWIDAGDGNDYVDGRSGSDVLNGNAGHDTLRGSEGADLLYGGSGNDTLWSSNDVGIDDSEENFLDGGSGEDAFLTSSHENDYHYRDTVRE